MATPGGRAAACVPTSIRLTAAVPGALNDPDPDSLRRELPTQPASRAARQWSGLEIARAGTISDVNPAHNAAAYAQRKETWANEQRQSDG